jgi:hypothetical protein
MANIVLGLGTSHTPLFTLESVDWKYRAEADMGNARLNLSDGRWVSYTQLLDESGPRYAADAKPEILQRKARECDDALDALGDALEQAAPDVAIIIGDDQGEMFSSANQPAFAVYHADELVTSDAFGKHDLPEWMLTMGRGYMMDAVRTIPGSSKIALQLVDGLIEREVDVATVSNVEGEHGLGHAFGFVVKRLFRGREIPIVPILLNTYYPPNVPGASRCFDIGTKLREVIDGLDDGLRVVLIASGGLSHFVVDEVLDRRVIAALGERDAKVLRSLPRGALNSGSSEILNWVMVSGALDGFVVRSARYVPLFRTPAGTGVGACFMVWGANAS